MDPSEFDPDDITEDLLLRYAVARDQDFAYQVQSTDPFEVGVYLSVEQETQVTVTPEREDEWCTCGEDAGKGTCTHVLFLATLENEVGEQIRDGLQTSLELVSDEITALEHELEVRKAQEQRLRDTLQLVQEPTAAFKEKLDEFDLSATHE